MTDRHPPKISEIDTDALDTIPAEWAQFAANHKELNLQCEPHEHTSGALGHDTGPARYVVDVLCPRCSESAVVLICEGRVADVVSGETTLDCNFCLHTASWRAFWRRFEVI